MVVQGADMVWSGLLGAGEVVGAAEGGSEPHRASRPKTAKELIFHQLGQHLQLLGSKPHTRKNLSTKRFIYK